MTEQKILDDLAAHNVAKVEIKFKGQMIEIDTDRWQFEPEKDGWLIKVEDVAGKVLALDHGLHLDDLDFGDDLYNEETIGGFYREEVEENLCCFDWTDYTSTRRLDTGTILINVEARTISITGTKQTVAVVTEPFGYTRQVEQKSEAEAAA